ncbi:MAG: cellulose binding domain-containing protein, partial [Butyrivibrio sp.]|nr:cellulose binding domain-containing protein [Butyrivibrio sp.]
FEAKGGAATLDAWQAVASSGTVTPPVSGTVNPYAKVEAENSSDYTDAKVSPAKNSVVIADNGYIRIDNVDFSQGVKEFTVYATSSKPGTKLNVYFDDSNVPAGTVNLGTDMTKGTTLSISSAFTGKHYIFFEAKGGAATLDAWQAVASSGTVTPPVSGTVNPYNKVEAENANNYTDARVSPGKNSVVISDNGYIRIDNIDFSKGVSGFSFYAQASQPKVKLNVYIDDAQQPIGTISVGTDMTKEVAVKLSTNITGTHYIYIEAKGGTATLDAWQAMPAGGAVVEPPVVADVNPYSTVEAETAPELSDARLTPNKQGVSIGAKGYVVAKNVVFSKGVSEFVLNANSTNASKIEIRVGSASGDLLGTATVNSSTKEIKVTSAKNLSGKKDLYFVNAGSSAVTLDSWKVTEYKEPVITPPVVDPPVVQTGLKGSYTSNAWTDGYQINFTVTNNSGKSVSNWKVKIKKSDINMTQNWCVNVSQEGDYYVITPLNWNSTIANGDSVTFGMIGSGKLGNLNYTVE